MAESLARMGFRSIDTLPDEQAVGWVNFDDPTTASGGHPRRSVSYISFSPCVSTSEVSRLDFWRCAPGPRSKSVWSAAGLRSRKRCSSHSLTRMKKADIKERVYLTLMSQAAPVPAMADVIWLNPGDADQAEIWLCATTPGLREQFVVLFEQTFDLFLSPINLFTPQPDPENPLWFEGIGNWYLTWLYGHDGDSLTFPVRMWP